MNQAEVSQIKQGEYVRRIDKNGKEGKKTYTRGEYDASSKRYSLGDCDDVGREVWVKKGTVLSIGFDY